MPRYRILAAAGLLVACTAITAPATAQTTEPVDRTAVEAIRKHGLEMSGLEPTLQVMNDVYGFRLTGSPGLDAASAWAADELRALGLENVSLEPWGPFGRGWTLNGFSMHARGDLFSFPVNAYPKAWSGSTNGPETGRVVIVQADTPEEVEAMADRIRGNVVLMGEPRDVPEPFEPIATRHSDSALLEMANWTPDPNADAGGGGRMGSPEAMERFRRQRAVTSAIHAAGPAAIIDASYKASYGTIAVSAASVATPPDAPPFGGRVTAYSVDRPEVVPQFSLAIEHFNRIHRLVSAGHEVTLDFELDAEYFDEDPMEYNVVGEMRGTDSEIGDQVVMLGGHYDAWHAGTGMTDNAAGSAVMMEVMRILRETYAELGTAPRRTIRIALWTGEEQGLLGSRAYVAQHFAETAGGGFMGGGVTEVKPAHAKLSAYYNLDNGTGKIRGVYLQENEGVEPIFRAWLQPFHDLGAATLTLQNTSGTDHLAFDRVGLPGFQFIQEPISYGEKTHHTNMDVFDHGMIDDLKQAATVIASFVYHTAERDDLLPRKPLPRAETDATSSR